MTNLNAEKTPVKKRRVGIVLLFSLATVLLGIVFLSTRSPKTIPQPVPPLNQKALEFVSYVMLEDVKALTNGQNSLAGTDGSSLGLFDIDKYVTAKEYEAAYDANEIAADNRFKEKKILLSGDVVSIDKDFTEKGIVTLRGSGLIGIHAELDANGMAGAASFVKGEHVHLVCAGTGRVMTIATLDDCIPFEDYMTRLSPPVESRLGNFLRGQSALPKNTALIVTGMYVIGLSLPSGSPCLNGVRRKCADEMTALLNDPSKSTAMRSQVMQMINEVK